MFSMLNLKINICVLLSIISKESCRGKRKQKLVPKVELLGNNETYKQKNLRNSGSIETN